MKNDKYKLKQPIIDQIPTHDTTAASPNQAEQPEQLEQPEQPPPSRLQQQQSDEERVASLDELPENMNPSCSAEAQSNAETQVPVEIQDEPVPVQLDVSTPHQEESRQPVQQQQQQQGPAPQSSETPAANPEGEISEGPKRAEKASSYRQVDKDDDLEEGELKDEDDDDDYEDEGEKDKQKTPSSENESPERPASSSSSSSPSSESSSSSSSSSSASKEQSSSKSSSKIGSRRSSSSRNNNTVYNRHSSSRMSSNRHISEDKYWIGRDREDPSEKAAKLISMRTKLLEARSREIELKFQKSKGITTQSSQQPSLISSTERSVKMTITKPSISYGENPNPNPVPNHAEHLQSKSSRRSSKPKDEDKVKKTKTKKKEKEKKKKKKKKSSSSSKKHRKHRSGKKTEIDAKSNGKTESELPYDNPDHQGPRTPPDNQVMTLEDEQIEWPSHLIRMTTAQPSISYSVNPGSVLDLSNESRNGSSSNNKRRNTLTPSEDRKKIKTDEKPSSISSSPQTSSPSAHKTEDGCSTNYESNLNSDYLWYYNYFVNTFEMDDNQAQHQACSALLSAGTYDRDALDKWLKSRGLVLARESVADTQDDNREDGHAEIVVTRLARNQVNRDTDDNEAKNLSMHPIKPKFIVIKSQKEIILPNGQVLPPGTVQKIVHPYPRPDSEVLGSYFDLY